MEAQKPTKTIADVLTQWISAKGGQINPRAAELGVTWNCLRDWAKGKYLPKRRDLPAIASVTGFDLDSLRALHTTDLHARVARWPRRIDTVEQAQAFAATHAPATTGQDGAADDPVHALHTTSPVIGAAQ